jgi:hypothetical protein
MTVSTRRRLPVSHGGGRGREALAPGWGQQPPTLVGQLGAAPAAVGQHPARHVGEQVLGHGQIREVGWDQAAVHDHPWPAHPQMGTQAKVSLLGDLVMAPGSQLPQPPAAIGPGYQPAQDGSRWNRSRS